MRPVDVAIVGDGPAGLALAAACGDAGVDCALVAPDLAARWPNRYGLWPDELVPLGLEDVAARRWPLAVVETGERRLRLARGYAFLDNDRARAALLARIPRTVEAAAQGVTPGPAGPRVQLDGGGELAARLVVDASGHRPALLADPGPPSAYQSAWGVEATPSHPPGEPGAATLMDLRDPVPVGAPSGPDAEPTFLYAADLGGGRWFVEETSLARPRPLPMRVLEQRLRTRLAASGIELTAERAVERCRFPLSAPLPRRDQPVVGYGAAAGMGHPATGYQVGQAFTRAPSVAAAVASALSDRAAAPAALARRAWAAVWPPDRLRQRALHDYGLAVLLRLGPAAQRRFFDEFFALPEGLWRAYLSIEDEAASRRAMLRQFARAGELRRDLLAPLRHREHRAELRAGLGLGTAEQAG